MNWVAIRRMAAVVGMAAVGLGLPLCAGAQASSGEAAKSKLVSFSTSAVVEVPRDLLSVTLTAVRDGADAAVVQMHLKQILEAALNETRKAVQPGQFEVRTGGFSLSPRYGRDGKINGWQGSAELVLEGSDTAKVGQLAGRLTGLNVSSVNYALSRSLREQHESQLTKEAVSRFRARAAELAVAFGYTGYELGEVNVQTGEPNFGGPVPMLRMAKAEVDTAAALPVEPGKGTITVTVSGSVVLKH